MSTATLNGVTVSRARVQIPGWGNTWADCETVEDADASGPVSLAIGSLTLACAVLNGGAQTGRAAYTLCGGKGKWPEELRAKPYRNDAGVSAATVMQDAARDVGETLAITGADLARRLGPHFARRKAPAYHILNALYPEGWYVNAAGVTVIGARPTAVEVPDAPVVKEYAAQGRYVLAPEEMQLAAYVPGATFRGERIADVEIHVEPDSLRVVLCTAPTFARRLTAWRTLFEAFDPWRIYRAPHEFRVLAPGDRLTVQPVRSVNGLPMLTDVPVRWAPGVKATVLPGALVVVQFIEGDPSRPCVTSGDAVGAPGFEPVTMQLGGPVGLGVAYQGSTVQAGPWAGAVLLGSTTVSVRP
jgi:hypothetical protein